LIVLAPSRKPSDVYGAPARSLVALVPILAIRGAPSGVRNEREWLNSRVQVEC